MDLVGQTFGRWEVLHLWGWNRHKWSTKRGCEIGVGSPLWFCRCQCGTERAVYQGFLRAGRSLSCGCYRGERRGAELQTHGEASMRSKTTEYRAWSGMRTRCHNPAHGDYKNYGGRGITVCERWNPATGGSYENFLADMGRKPTPEHSLDRIHVNGNYEPANCRWATPTEQVNNRRLKRIENFTDAEILAEFCRRQLIVEGNGT